MVQEISIRVIAAAILKAISLIASKLMALTASPPRIGEVNVMSGNTGKEKSHEPSRGAADGGGRKALFVFSLATDALLITAQVMTSAWGVAPFTRSEFLAWTISVSMFAVAGAYAMLLKGTRPQRVLALKLLPVVALVLCLDAYTSANYFATQFNKDTWVQAGTTSYLQDVHDHINRIMLEVTKEQDAAEAQVRAKKGEMNLEETGFRAGHAPGRGREFKKLEGEIGLLTDEAARLAARNDQLRRKLNEVMEPVSGVANPDAQAVQGVRDRFNTALRTLVSPQLAAAAGVKPLDPLETFNQNSTSLLAMVHDIRRGDPGAIVALFIAVVLELLVLTLSAVTIGLSTANGFPNLFEDYRQEKHEAARRQRELAESETAQRLMSASNQAVIELDCQLRLEKAMAEKEHKIRETRLANQKNAREVEESSLALEEERRIFSARKRTIEIEREREEFEHEKRVAEINRGREIYEDLSPVMLDTEKLDRLWELSRFPGMTREEWAAKMEPCVRSAQIMRIEDGSARQEGYCIPLSVVRKQKLNAHFMLLQDKKFVELVSAKAAGRGSDEGWFYLLSSPVIFGAGPTHVSRKERAPVGKVHQFGR